MAYEKLGADCLHEFDGMFALAIYDKQKKQLFLARDRAGKNHCTTIRIRTSLFFAANCWL
jgi:asparagine synthase (glutamine-hydrolysing)